MTAPAQLLHMNERQRLFTPTNCPPPHQSAPLMPAVTSNPYSTAPSRGLDPSALEGFSRAPPRPRSANPTNPANPANPLHLAPAVETLPSERPLSLTWPTLSSL